MKALFMVRRWVMLPVLAAFAVLALTPAAYADGRRYKGAGRYYNPPRRVVYVERHSDAAPLVAGLIGGIVLGTALAHASEPVVERVYEERVYEPAYYYWDPYCQERFTSLAVYRSHVHRHVHPGVVRVISVESGRWVDTYHWRDGGWCAAPASYYDGCGR